MNKRAAEQSCISLLQLCDSLSKLAQIQANIFKLGLQTNPLVLTKFTSISSGINAIHYATPFIFSQESEPRHYDAFLFNTIIEAYANTPHSKRTAISHYNKMLTLAIRPNNYTFPFLFKACAGLRSLNLGKSLHASVSKLGLCNDMYVLNSMIHIYSSCENGIKFAEKVFDEMPEPNSVSWDTMVGGYVKWGMSGEAVGLLRRMQKLEIRTEVCNSLIDMFAKCGDIDNALSCFTGMPHIKRTVVTWTSIISGLALHGRGEEAVSLFEEMKRGGDVIPDDVAFIAVLTACSHSGLVEEGKRYFDSMANDYGIEARIEHYGCMVDMLSRGGLVEEAMGFIDAMPLAPNAVIWRSVIAACRDLGRLDLVERITENLIKKDPKDEANYVLLSNIYARRLDWEKKSAVREAMGKKGIRKVPGNTMIELECE